MKKKSLVILIVTLVLVIAAGAAGATYAVWDAQSVDLSDSTEFTTGDSHNILVNKVDFPVNKNNFRPDGALATPNSVNEITISSFTLTLKEFIGVTYTVDSITMNTVTDATPFMKATIYKVTKDENGVETAREEIATDAILTTGVSYIVTLKFTVDANSDLLDTNMKRSNITVSINLAGYTAPAQGGQA